MSDEIIKVLDALGEKLGIVIDWTQQNVQPYIQDLCQRAVQYKLSTCIASLALSAIVLILGISLLIYIIGVTVKKHLKYNSDDARFAVQAVGYTAACLMVIFGTPMLLINLNNLFGYTYLPEKALLEIIQSI